MVEEGQGPAAEHTQPQGGESRPAGRRGRAAAQSERAAAPLTRAGLPPHIASAIVSAVVLAVLAPALFVGGFFTHEAVDGGGGSSSASAPNPTATQAAAQVTPQPTATPPVVVKNINIEGQPSWGPTDAKVIVVEFSDFQCPYCGRFATQTYPQIKQTYGDKILFVFRNFPLTQLHANAQKAAEAGECANEQGKFWEFQDKLFANQSALDVPSLKNYASQLGLNTDTFNQCLDSDKYTAEVQKDLQDGTTYGVQGTPSFFINGLLVEGALPFADYQDASGQTQKGLNSLIAAALQNPQGG